MIEITLSTLRTAAIIPQRRFQVLVSVSVSVDPKAIVKNSKDPIGNQTRKLLACSAGAQRAILQRST